MIHGIQYAFLVMGGWTILSSVVFHELRNDDGNSVARANGDSRKLP
jgi:hypothetical protein